MAARQCLWLVSLVVLSPSAARAQLAPGDPAAKFELTVFASGLTAVTDVAFLPDGRAVLTQQHGDLVIRRRDGTLAKGAGHVEVRPFDGEQGLLGVVADPAFASNRTIYLFASAGEEAADKHKVLRAQVGDDDRITIEARPLVDQGLEGPANHDGGGLVIHDGHLYISVGDTGWNAIPPSNRYASCLNKPNGKILRIALDGSVPRDNPLVGLTAVTGCTSQVAAFAPLPPDERIFAWGLRNPYRFWVDPRTGLLWIGDVGEGAREEISVGGKGRHFGYPFEEGGMRWGSVGGLDCSTMSPATECTRPAYDYQNLGPASDNCVIGGLIPEGCGWPPEYIARYFFGDHGTGHVWTVDVTPDRRGVIPDSRRDFATVAGLAGFRQGLDAALYAVSVDGNVVVRIAPRGQTDACARPAEPAPTPDAAAPDAPTVQPPPAAASGCGCSAGGGPSGLLLLLVALLAARRFHR